MKKILCVAILLTAFSTSVAYANTYVWFDGYLLGAHITKPPSGAPAGWVIGEELQNDEKYRTVRHSGGNECKIYSSQGYEGEGIAGVVKQDHPGEFEEVEPGLDQLPMIDIERSGQKNLTVRSELLALWGDAAWNPIPRKAAALATNSATYNKVVRDYLAQRGLPNAQPCIALLYKIDLEGDGTDEVVIYAHNLPEKDAQLHSKKGEYSIGFVRKIVGGKVLAIPLYEFIDTTEDPDYHKHPILLPTPGIVQFADLDGDGVMEIIVRTSFYEGGKYTVFGIRGSEAKTVLQVDSY
jgi:hypothetical protein